MKITEMGKATILHLLQRMYGDVAKGSAINGVFVFISDEFAGGTHDAASFQALRERLHDALHVLALRIEHTYWQELQSEKFQRSIQCLTACAELLNPRLPLAERCASFLREVGQRELLFTHGNPVASYDKALQDIERLQERLAPRQPDDCTRAHEAGDFADMLPRSIRE